MLSVTVTPYSMKHDSSWNVHTVERADTYFLT
jgi:hypothetical protein